MLLGDGGSESPQFGQQEVVVVVVVAVIVDIGADVMGGKVMVIVADMAFACVRCRLYLS